MVLLQGRRARRRARWRGGCVSWWGWCRGRGPLRGGRQLVRWRELVLVGPPDKRVVQTDHAELFELLAVGALAAGPAQPEAAVDPAVEALDARSVRVQLLVQAGAGRDLADVLTAV